MRLALIRGGITSLVLTAALLLAMPKHDPVGPKHDPVGATVAGGGFPFVLGQLSEGVQDFLLIPIIYAFFSCGTSIQGAGARLAFGYARDGALPAAGWGSRVHPRFKTPVNALLAGVVITIAFCLLVFVSPKNNVHIWFVTYPGGVNALLALVSFAVSGIYLSFLLTVIGSMIARSRGWVPEGSFRLSGAGGGPCLVDHRRGLPGPDVRQHRVPHRDHEPREFFNLDWITLAVIFVIAVVGAVYFVIARPDRGVARHVHDELEATGAERAGSPA